MLAGFRWPPAAGYGMRATFGFSGLAAAIIPLAGWMGRATESLADALSSALGELLNATFGNAAEVVIGLVAISKGPKMYPLVKASLTGFIIGNVLLVLGAAILTGGLRYRQQRFNRQAARMNATLLVLAATGLIMPALFHQATVVRGATDAIRSITWARSVCRLPSPWR